MKPIKEILNQECNSHQISVEAVIKTRDFLEEITTRLAKEGIKEMDKYNEGRKIQGLKEIKRLPAWVVEKVTHNILKQIDDTNIGFRSEEVVSLGGCKMLKDKKAIKSAKEDDSRMEACYEL
ncbi:MAG: hypothetical protein U9O96_06305 [Candidatus Thermoplasmatota archaeon]|nr:hypothetical protein [Candidatus Thermoplasmatota archaeon]